MSLVKQYDAIVVGGGPAGATTAYGLARAGMNICIIDKQTFPRPKLCAGLITWKTVQCINRIFGSDIDELKTRGLVRHELREYRIFHHRTELARGTLDFPFHLVDRKRYDHFWLKKATGAGAELIAGRKVEHVKPATGRVTLDNGDSIDGRSVIGADGAWSRVRSAIFPSVQDRRRWRNQLAMTIEKRHPTPDMPSYAALHFGFVPWGYAWSFPENDHQILGIGSLRHKDHQPFKEGFGHFLESIGLDDCAVPPWQGHPLPFGNYLTVPGLKRVLLTGDACGLADPLLGEGIFYAHRSGELAAEAVIASPGDVTDSLVRYRKALARHIVRELNWIKFYRNLLFFGGHRRRFRGLKLFFRLFPKRLEAVIQGQRSFGRLLMP